MEQGLYSNLSVEEKLALLYFERGKSALVKLSHYEDISANPNQSPNTSNLYISSVLGFDWEEYTSNGDNMLSDESKREAVKKAAISITSKQDIRSSHIVDALSDVLYFYTHPDEGYAIDSDLIRIIDTHIERIYKVFTDFDKVEDKYKYE